MNEWHDFFVATAGAAAALTGLIFVGVSISLTKILSVPHLPNRALVSLIFLLAILVLSLLVMVPGQSFAVVGAEALALSLAIWVVVVRLDINNISYAKKTEYIGHYRINALLNQMVVLPYIASAIILLNNSNAGLYWLVPGIIFSFIKAVMDAWVLLVEINR